MGDRIGKEDDDLGGAKKQDNTGIDAGCVAGATGASITGSGLPASIRLNRV